MYDALIVSDVHLGSKISQAGALLRLLKRLRYGKLILLGDIFQDINFEHFKKEHWDLLRFLRFLSEEKPSSVVWVLGNHDKGASKVLSSLIGVEAVDTHEFLIGGKKAIAMHGHQFTETTTSLSGFGGKMFRVLQSLLGESDWAKSIYRSIDSTERTIAYAKMKVREGAIKFAKKKGYKYIMCGHTHQAETAVQEDITYLNSGQWISNECFYILVQDDKVSVESLVPEM